MLTGLSTRLRLARLMLLTGPREQQGDLAEVLSAALDGGVDVVQLVLHHVPAELATEALATVRRVAEPRQALVGVRGVRGSAGLDLLHLGAADGRSGPARRPLSPWALLGRSVHDPAQLNAALADEALDYLTVGPADGPDGAVLLAEAVRRAPTFDLDALPWFAVGGVDATRLPALLTAGVHRVAVGDALLDADDPAAAARALTEPLARAWRAHPASFRYGVAAAARPGRR